MVGEAEGGGPRAILEQGALAEIHKNAFRSNFPGGWEWNGRPKFRCAIIAPCAQIKALSSRVYLDAAGGVLSARRLEGGFV